MADDEVLIKIAADVAEANAAIQTMGTSFGTTLENIAQNTADTSLALQVMVGVMAGLAEGMTETGNKAAEAAPKAQSFWEMMFGGAEKSQTAAVAWGTVLGKSLETLQEGVTNAVMGFPNMIKGMADAGDEAKTMAARLGTTTTSIAEMKYIGEQAGVSTETMARAMQGLSTSLTDSGSKASQAIRGLGISLDDLKGKSDTDQLRMIVDQIKALPPEVDKGAKMMEVFGAKARNMTQLTSENLGELQTKFKELGGADNQEALGDLGDEFNDLSNNIKVAGESFNRSMAVMFLPGINAVLEKVPMLGGAVISVGGAMADLGQSMLPLMGNMVMLTGSDKGLAGLVEGLGKAKESIKNFGADALKMAQSMRANLIPNLLAMTQAVIANTIAMLANPWVLAGIALAGLAAIIYNMIGGWDGLVKAMEPVLQFFEDIYTIGEALAGEIFADLVEWVGELVTWFDQLFTSTSQGMGPLNELITWAQEWISWLEQFPIIGEYIKLVKMELEFLWAAAKQLYEWVTKFGAAVVGWFKSVAEEAHATAEGIRAEDAALAHAKKLGEDLAKTKADAAKGTEKQITASDRLKAKTDQLNSAYKSLTAEQKKNIKEALAAGQSAKEIAEGIGATLYHNTLGVDEATKVIDRFKDEMKDAETAAKKDPFHKLQEDATALAKAMDLATKSGQTTTQQIDAFGKKADEIAQKAALRGELNKIPPAIVEMGAAFQKAELAKAMETINSKSLELATTFNDKLRDAGIAAANAIKGMNESILQTTMNGSELRIAQIDKERDAQLVGIQATKQGLEDALRDRGVKERELADKEIEERKKRLVAGQVMTEEEMAGIRMLHEAVVTAAAEDTKVKLDALDDQSAAAKRYAEYMKQLASYNTGIYEADAKAAGLITKKAMEAELALQTRKLAIMREKSAEYTTFAIQQQERLVAEMMNIEEKDAKERGLVTKAARDAELKAQTDNLTFMQNNKEKFYEWEITRQKAQTERLKSAFEQEAKARGMTTKAEMVAEREIAEADLKWKLDHEKLFTKEQIEEAKKRVQAAKEAAGETKKAWVDAMGGIIKVGSAIGSVFDEIGAQGSDAMKKVGSAVGSAMEIMGGVQSLTAMLDAKDTIGAIIAACKIAVAAIKAMWDAFTKSPGEDIVGRVGQRMGVVIGEELGNTIAETAKEKFDGDRFAAEVFHLSDIVEAAGGVTEKNFEKLLGGLRDTFTMLEKKMFTVEQARESLDKNFGIFADHVVKSGKIASASFVEMIRLNKELGVNSKEVAAFVTGQTTALGTSFEKLVSPQLKASETSKEELKKLRDEWTKTDQAIGKMTLEDKGGMEVYKDLSKMSKEQKAELANLNIEWDRNTAKVKAAEAAQAKMAKEAMPALDRAGRLMTSTFNAAVASGVGFSEAVDQMGPGLDSILKTMDNLGISVEDSSVSWIVSFRNRVNANKELVDSTGSLNEIMLGMSNIGALNEDSLKDLEAQGLESFAKLKEAGFQDNEALKMMAGFLTNARDAHVQMGIPIDENTQSLITQAEEAGIIKEQQLDTNAIMMEGLGAIIEAVGGKIPEAWKKAEKAAIDSAKTVADTVDDTVNGSIEDTEKALQDQERAWQEEAREADKAALAMKKSMSKIDLAVDGVADALDDTDWDGWAEEAVDAAEDVQEAVDGVSLGHSPGGLKEIPLKLKAAQDAFRIWERTGVTSATQVQDAIDAMHGRDLGIAGLRTAGVATQMPTGEFVRQVTQSEAADASNNAPVNLTFNITSMDPAGVELVTERKILPAMVKILRRGRNLADMQTVLNLKG